jgi:hypothetical protein
MRNPNPVTIRGQLNAYYARQGLTAKEMRKAIQHDMRRIAVYVKRDNAWAIKIQGYEKTRKMHADIGLGIAGTVLFADTKEGVKYWSDRASEGLAC